MGRSRNSKFQSMRTEREAQQRETRTLELGARHESAMRLHDRRVTQETQEFEPVVLVVGTLSVDLEEAHTRSLVMGGYLADRAEVEMPLYVEVRHARQRDCEHVIGHIDRFGGGECDRCYAIAWSGSWVAAGVYSEDTFAWTLGVDERWSERAARRLTIA